MRGDKGGSVSARKPDFALIYNLCLWIKIYGKMKKSYKDV